MGGQVGVDVGVDVGVGVGGGLFLSLLFFNLRYIKH